MNVKGLLLRVLLPLGIVGGLVGTIVPFLPGTTFILGGCCLHYFAMGRESSGLTWISLVIIAILFVASVVIDYLSGAMGAKWFGSSKWGVVGAIVGGLIGLSFSLPGIIIGPLVGVFAFEVMFGEKKVKEAGNSTVGTMIGGTAGIIAGVAIGFLMIACYAIDVLVLK